MPNWVYNEVEIAAPLSQVQAYLFETDDSESSTGWKTHYFNLHTLFPERFEAGDERGLQAWDYDWMLEYVGSKWNPRIEIIEDLNGRTGLAFDTAWSAPESLLKRLHELTGWKIINRHDDPDAEHDLVMTCEGGTCVLELLPGTTTCSNCEDHIERELLDDDYGECPTCFMSRDNYLVTVEADWPAKINVGENSSTDLYGDVVLGIVSAHSKRQAMSFLIHRIPEKARQDDGWHETPEDFGLRAYKLAQTDEEEG